ncbi:hypothetical protein AJ79_10192 [Helicocarpus griseus UAMH5409]|uniref:F-box domain-containing protein n=1 Tax=Helicocarpus griseus UAMH5409 TaxID=1447875 RepID=A0A2B7WFF1_9EURO|nr:hypothetical protein AJ79_10192 [Helicocarpus griseus UAMH5409]
MALGFAHRRSPMCKINLLPLTSTPWASNWNSISKPRSKCDKDKLSDEAKHPEDMKSATVGKMDALPVELMFMLMRYLDLKSAGNFRLVNRKFNESTEDCHEHKSLKKYASQTLTVIRRTGVASAFSLQQLYAELTQPFCRGCDSFGPFIFLPTAQRCCDRCLGGKYQLKAMPVNLVQDALAVSRYSVEKNLPVVRSPSTLMWRARNLVSAAEAGRFAIKKHGSWDGVETALIQNHAKSAFLDQNGGRMRSAALQMNSDSHTGSWLRYISGSYRYKYSFAGWKDYAATELPFWIPGKDKSESAIYCSACHFRRCLKSTYDGEPLFGRRDIEAFTLDTIPRHFETCQWLRMGYTPEVRNNFRYLEDLGPDFLVDEDGREVDTSLR